MKLSMALRWPSESALTVTLKGLALTLASVNVTPVGASVTVLVEAVMVTPSTFTCASWAACIWVRVDSCAGSPVLPVVEIVLAAPVVLLRSIR